MCVVRTSRKTPLLAVSFHAKFNTESGKGDRMKRVHMSRWMGRVGGIAVCIAEYHISPYNIRTFSSFLPEKLNLHYTVHIHFCYAFW
jgi:hypothetical protein